MNITHVILPVAGLGKRLMPLTANTPKALVAAHNRPLLDYILDEVYASGLSEVILVASPQHRRQFEEYLAAARKRFPDLRFHMKFQGDPFGNGHALLAASDIVGENPFAVRFCDDLLVHDAPALGTLVDLYRRHEGSVFVLERVPREEISRYGVVAVERKIDDGFYKIGRVVEKPNVAAEDMSKLSNLAVLGAYVFSPAILEHLQRESRVAPPLPDALPWTVAAHRELAGGGAMYGWEFPGKRLDCGTLPGLQEAEKFLAGRSRGA